MAFLTPRSQLYSPIICNTHKFAFLYLDLLFIRIHFSEWSVRVFFPKYVVIFLTLFIIHHFICWCHETLTSHVHNALFWNYIQFHWTIPLFFQKYYIIFTNFNNDLGVEQVEAALEASLLLLGFSLISQTSFLCSSGLRAASCLGLTSHSLALREESMPSSLNGAVISSFHYNAVVEWGREQLPKGRGWVLSTQGEKVSEPETPRQPPFILNRILLNFLPLTTLTQRIRTKRTNGKERTRGGFQLCTLELSSPIFH